MVSPNDPKWSPQRKQELPAATNNVSAVSAGNVEKRCQPRRANPTIIVCERNPVCTDVPAFLQCGVARLRDASCWLVHVMHGEGASGGEVLYKLVAISARFVVHDHDVNVGTVWDKLEADRL
jgi:hypothetical protein